MENINSSITVDSKPTLHSYNTINNLYKILESLININVYQNIYKKYAADISSVFNYFGNEIHNPEYNGHLATLELQAIMLRLSRHHIKRAKIIENISQFFLEVLSYISRKGKVKEIIFKNAEYIDRPSLMIVNRLIILLQKNKVDVKVNFVFQKNIFKSESNHNLIRARVQVFNKLDRILNIRETSKIINEDNPINFEDFILDRELYNTKILNAAIIEQNFELAFIILEKNLSCYRNDKIISEQMAYRNIGVIESNLGNFDTALHFFDRSLMKSANVIEFSRNSYIKGLCLIKRLHKVEEGLRVIKQALQKLEDNYIEDVKYKHEKAWLINGISLAETLLASKLCTKKKEKKLLDIIKNEMMAYKIISKESSFQLVYLKFNILANIAFLLEILGNYSEAINFWEQAFQPLLTNDGNYREGEKSLTYRLGILNIKLSNLEKSNIYLSRALDLTRSERNPFHLNMVLYSIVYLKLLEGDRSNHLIKLINEGEKLSKNLNDKDFIILFKQSKECFDNNMYIEKLTFPKVKLISYIPYIDLSFVPEVDLNKKLTS